MHEGALHARHEERVVKLVPGGERSLAHLSDGELLMATRRLVGTSNRLFAALLLHLAEVETRGIHRERACASLYTYCIYELRLSEDAAARRCSAARWVKRFPALLDAIAAGELHLTGLLMLGPHLTPENHFEVLARAKFRTKKEIAKLVRELHPLPGVPDVMEPLGPELRSACRNPSREQWLTSLCPPVRELDPADRPNAWASDLSHFDGAALEHSSSRSIGVDTTEPAQAADRGAASEPLFTAPARHERPPITGPQQYQLQFCTTEEHVKLVERAKALLSRTSPGASLGELHLRAMKLLVAELEKQKFAVTARPRKAKPPAPQSEQRQGEAHHEPPRQRGRDEHNPHEPPRQRGCDEHKPGDEQRGCDEHNLDDRPPRQRGGDEHNPHEPPCQSGCDEHKPGDEQRGCDEHNLDDRPPRQGESAEGEVDDQSPRQRGCDEHNLDDRRPRQGGSGEGEVDDRSPRRRERETQEESARRRECEVQNEPREVLDKATRGCDAHSDSPRTRGAELGKNAPRRRGRHVAAAVKREVYLRDGGCCGYVDERGERCGETRYLEFHHLQPYARGGAHVAANLSLRCTAHNALAAEKDFGRRLIESIRDAAPHESFTTQGPPDRSRAPLHRRTSLMR